MTQIILEVKRILELSQHFRSTLLQRIETIKQIKSLPKTRKNKLLIQKYLEQEIHKQAKSQSTR